MELRTETGPPCTLIRASSQTEPNRVVLAMVREDANAPKVVAHLTSTEARALALALNDYAKGL